MFAGIFSCTPSFSPEINKVYLILSYDLSAHNNSCDVFSCSLSCFKLHKGEFTVRIDIVFCIVCRNNKKH